MVCVVGYDIAQCGFEYKSVQLCLQLIVFSRFVTVTEEILGGVPA